MRTTARILYKYCVLWYTHRLSQQHRVMHRIAINARSLSPMTSQVSPGAEVLIRSMDNMPAAAEVAVQQHSVILAQAGRLEQPELGMEIPC